MAIRFHCPQCRQLLSIASRKAGAIIECPKCATFQVVPDESTADAALGRAGAGPEQAEPISATSGDEVEAISLDEPSGPTSAPLPPAPPPSAPIPPPLPDDASLCPTDWILFPRRTIYVQGALFVVLAAASFGFGVIVGRISVGSTPIRPPPRQTAEAEDPQPIFVEGKLVYDPGDGRLVGDQSAVIFFLPEGRGPARPIPIHGLRPQDPAPPEYHRGLREIEELGGVYARADASGAFTTVLPRPGRYRVLLISRHASRREDDSIEEVDREEIGEYFNRPADLIGRSKYRWTLEEFHSDSPAVTYNFGLDGK